MYFTREPIIETIISPREGYKLVLRSSKHDKQEEYYVDSVEVVNFGNHCFYRSLDRSVTFLLPVFDYEIVETRSARLMVKAAPVTSSEKEIKIGKGDHHSEEKKKEKRSSRKRKEKEKGMMNPQREESSQEGEPMILTPPPMEEVKPPKPVVKEGVVRTLIPPPTTLISESLVRYTQGIATKAEEELAFVPEEEESFSDEQPDL